MSDEGGIPPSQVVSKKGSQHLQLAVVLGFHPYLSQRGNPEIHMLSHIRSSYR